MSEHHGYSFNIGEESTPIDYQEMEHAAKSEPPAIEHYDIINGKPVALSGLAPEDRQLIAEQRKRDKYIREHPDEIIHFGYPLIRKE